MQKFAFSQLDNKGKLLLFGLGTANNKVSLINMGSVAIPRSIQELQNDVHEVQVVSQVDAGEVPLLTLHFNQAFHVAQTVLTVGKMKC